MDYEFTFWDNIKYGFITLVVLFVLSLPFIMIFFTVREGYKDYYARQEFKAGIQIRNECVREQIKHFESQGFAVEQASLYSTVSYDLMFRANDGEDKIMFICKTNGEHQIFKNGFEE